MWSMAAGPSCLPQGISAGIDLALAVIARYEGKETAQFAAKRLEWTGNWAESTIHPAPAPVRPKTGPLVHR